MTAAARRNHNEERRVLLEIANDFAFQTFTAEEVEECNDRVFSANSTIEAMLVRLVKRGWIAYVCDEESDELELTDAGREYAESTVNGNIRPFDDPGDRPWDWQEA